MTAPRPMRSSWCMGITERPRTTEISTFTLSTLEAISPALTLVNPARLPDHGFGKLNFAPQDLRSPRQAGMDDLGRAGALSRGRGGHGGPGRSHRRRDRRRAGLAAGASPDLHRRDLGFRRR